MGNSAGKESRSPSQPSSIRSPASPPFPSSPGFPPPSTDRGVTGQSNSRTGRPSRHDISLFGLGGGGSDRDATNLEQRRETKQEREARKLEKERVARAKERERSVREEGVDGGYLVTLGTYVGPEDFSKSIVRQLQIERRLAPFWRGLNDHSSSWTEHQLVAAARGKPIPAPDEIPPQDESPAASEKGQQFSALGLETDTNRSASSINLRTSSSEQAESGASATVLFPNDGNEGRSKSPSVHNSTPGPLFLGRAKTLASLTSTKSSNLPSESTPQEIRLPRDPNINGQPIEAFLYKDVAECPICFLYYPPYLNQTRCCDQPICSECFVQIKRPDPHPPDHADPNEPPASNPGSRIGDDDEQLVSESATCPFCVQPEFGVTYDPPPFRRGLGYANQNVGSASSLSLSKQNAGFAIAARRRGQSLSASAHGVITIDMVRPNWAKKLSDARSHAARRSAAATALHTAAYMMNGSGGSGFRGLGRRRRPMLLDGSGSGAQRLETMNPAHVEQMLAMLEGQETSPRERRGTHDLFPGRVSSRGGRNEDLEEIMMMEAIRQSLAAEDERKKKEEKEAAKEAKKEEKKRVKEQKKADKVAKKNGGIGSSSSSANNSGFFSTGGPSSSAVVESSHADGKGKAKASSPEGSRPRGLAPLGFTALDEPSSVLHNQSFTTSRGDPQKHLELSRANLGSDVPYQNFGGQQQSVMSKLTGQLPRNQSFTSSSNSSLLDAPSVQPGTASDASSLNAETPPNPASLNRNNDPNASGFNFGSLAEMIGNEGVPMSDTSTESGNSNKRSDAPQPQSGPLGDSRNREGSAENSSSSRSPPRYFEGGNVGRRTQAGFGDGKHSGNDIITSVVDRGDQHGETH